MALCSSQPRPTGWDANLHLMLKLVGASFADGPRAAARRALPGQARGAQRAVAADCERRPLGLRRRAQHRLLLAALAQDARVRRARSERLARLAAPRAPGRHGARAGHDPRPHRGQDRRCSKACTACATASGEWRWVVSRAKARVDATRAPAAAGRCRIRHHRAQALRGCAVQGKGKRADHAAVDRRRRHHHRRPPDRRVPESRRPRTSPAGGSRKRRASTSTTSSAASTRRPASRWRTRCRWRSAARARSSRCGRRC